MESIGVLLLAQVIPYLKPDLNKRYNLFRIWDFPQKSQLLIQHGTSIRVVVGRSTVGVAEARNHF